MQGDVKRELKTTTTAAESEVLCKLITRVINQEPSQTPGAMKTTIA
jgi:hypothetical protein